MKFFFQKTHFFRNYPNIRTLWEVLLFQSHYTTNLLLLPIFKIFIFFKKSVTFLRKKMNVLRNPKPSVAFYDTFAIFSDFQKLMFFLEKLILFFYLKKIERFENFYYFCRILRQICYFYRFLNYSFFSKKAINF